jgi:hypothetical protein
MKKMLNTSKPLQAYYPYDGSTEDAAYVGEVCIKGEDYLIIRVCNSDYLVDNYGRLRCSLLAGQHFRVQVKEPVVTTTYCNVYDDGTLGVPKSCVLIAQRYSQYDKTRLGILQITSHDGEVVCKAMLKTPPQMRTRERPEGFNPYTQGDQA